MTNQNKNIQEDWMTRLIAFYDFVWQEGVEAHGSCINNELMADFAEGGSKFDQMKELIIKKFPTQKDAERAFSAKQ